MEQPNENLEAQLYSLFIEKIINSSTLDKWEALDTNISFINGLPMQKFRPINSAFYNVIKIRELSQGFCDENSECCRTDIEESHIIYNGEIVFSWSGILQVAFWTSQTAGLNQHLFKVESNQYPKWYIYLCIKHHLIQFKRIAENKGTTFGHIRREDIHNALIKTITSADLERLNPIFESVVQEILINSNEIHRLKYMSNIILACLSN